MPRNTGIFAVTKWKKEWQNPNVTKSRPSTRSNNQGQKVNCQKNDQKPATTLTELQSSLDEMGETTYTINNSFNTSMILPLFMRMAIRTAISKKTDITSWLKFARSHVTKLLSHSKPSGRILWFY